MAAKIKFLRRNTGDYSRLGRRRKKLQKWRKPKGRDNKMRLREKGYPRTVEIGYKQNDKVRGKIDGKSVVVVKNVSELEKCGKDNLIIIARIGYKKREEIIKLAKEKGLEVTNKRKPRVKKEKKAKVEDKKGDKKKDKKVEEKVVEKVEEKKADVKTDDKKQDVKSEKKEEKSEENKK